MANLEQSKSKLISELTLHLQSKFGASQRTRDLIIRETHNLKNKSNITINVTDIVKLGLELY